MRTVLVGVVLTLLLLGGAVAGLLLVRGDGGTAPAEAVPGTAAEGPLAFEEQVAPTEPVPLPARTLEGFGGAPPVDLAAYRGAPLVVNFWATWCDPCVEEMPGFQEVASQVEGRVAFLGVDVADGPRQAEPFVAELGITYDLARDPDRTFARELRIIGMPTTLFVDAEGMIVHRHATPLDADQLRQAIRDHLDVEV